MLARCHKLAPFLLHASSTSLKLIARPPLCRLGIYTANSTQFNHFVSRSFSFSTLFGDVGSAIVREIEANNPAKVAELLKAQTDVGKITHKGFPLLYYAATGGNVEIVKLLLDSGVDPAILPKATAAAVNMNRIPVAKLLFERGVSVNQPLTTMYKSKVEGRGTQCTALDLAAAAGHTEMVELLLDKGADINAGNSLGTPLMHAVFENHLPVVQLLLKRGADFKESRNEVTPLIIAATCGNIEMTKALLDAGANIDQQGPSNRSALLGPLEKGHVEIVKLLLDRGAQVNVANINGTTPLMFGALQGKTEVVRLLLEKGVDVNQRDNEQQTALLYPFLNEDFRDYKVEVLKMLVKSGATVNQYSANKSTPSWLRLTQEVWRP